MANTPLCPRCHRSMLLLAEEDTNWQFGCDTCKIAHVFTKPQSKGLAKEQVKEQRADNWRKQLRALESRPKYFDLKLRSK